MRASKIFLTAGFVLISFIASASQHERGMDSLLIKLRTSTTNEIQIETASEFLKSAFYTTDATSLKYCDTLILLSDSLHNKAIFNLANAYSFIRKQKFDSSVYFYSKTLDDLKQPGQLRTRVKVEADFITEMNAEDKLTTYKLAINFIKDAETLKNYKDASDGFMYQNLVYTTLNSKAALSFADSAIKYAYLSKDSEYVSNRLGLKAQTYMAQSNFDSAIVYILKGIDIVKNVQKFSFARATNNLILLSCYIANKDTAKFLENVIPFCEYDESAPQPYWIAPCREHRALAHIFRHEYKEAINDFLTIFNNPTFQGDFFKEDIDNMYLSTSECYAELKDYKNSYLYLKKAHDLYVEINNLNQTNMLRDLEAKQSEEKQKIQVKLQEEKLKVSQTQVEQQQQQRVVLIGGLGLLLLIIIIIIFNRNKIVRLNKQLETATENAIKSEKYKQQFLAFMSHEIRSPMNAVLGAVNLAVENEKEAKNKKYLNIAQRSAQHLLHIINDVLDISKIESGKLEIENIPFSVDAVIKDMIAAQKIKADEKGLDLISENLIEEEFSIVMGDPLRLNQILTNLLNNAVKFTEEGRITITASKINSGSDNSPLLKIEIQDSGIGMSVEQLQNLFSEYSQATTATSRKFGGTGLGLAISRQLVELMNGTIEVRSDVGKGTVFTISLPCLKAEKQLLHADVQIKEQSWRFALNNLSIILADDIEDSRIITHDLILHYLPGITISLAQNGIEVVNLVQSADYDLLLLDLDMPLMNGYEAAQKIRNELKSDIPIIALTASILTLNKSELAKFGIDDVLAKPFIPEDLFITMQKLLELKNKI